MFHQDVQFDTNLMALQNCTSEDSKGKREVLDKVAVSLGPRRGLNRHWEISVFAIFFLHQNRGCQRNVRVILNRTFFMTAICGHVVSIHQVLLATNSQSLTNTITPDVEAGMSYQLSRLRKWLIYSANGKPSIIFEDSDLLSMKLWCASKNLGITVRLLHEPFHWQKMVIGVLRLGKA